MSNVKTLAEAIANFGNTAKSKLSNPSATGAPEDQLRAPLETLIADMEVLVGLPSGSIVPVGESSLADLKTRPDYAVTLHNALIGFIEVKAPGKGADPRRFSDKHDKEQWVKLQSLPNLLYTDGNAFSLWRNGKLEGQVIVLDGDIATAGNKLSGPPSLVGLFSDFFQWAPQSPRNAKELADITAKLCRLLRDEVSEHLSAGSKSLTELAADWRKLLFPNATDEAFADGYAQAVTFGLLMARASDISLHDGLDHVAKELRQTNTLIGSALRLLTDQADEQPALTTSLRTLTRVLDAVEWSKISKGDPEAWLYFYEEFLSVYDNTLRKKTGSYYTPPQVVEAMVRLVDEALCSSERFALPQGLASDHVTIVDPAMGTGTYLLGIMRRIADKIEADQGAGAVAGVIKSAMSRLIGFEIQFGPFAVAQLRLHAELRELAGQKKAASENVTPVRLFVTDTLGNPYAEEEYIPQILKPLGDSRQAANKIKRDEPITVVIGNPPYKEKAKGMGGWIESGSGNTSGALMDWMPPTDWDVGTHAKHLRNLYVYFWRWAAWKVFGDGERPETLSRSLDRRGIISFITVAGFLNGPGFQKMRSDLRRDADEIWVIDCSPEGHQPPVSSRIFEGVQQPVCIVMASRRADTATDTSARVRYRALPAGHRKDKFTALAQMTLDEPDWTECSSDPRASFYPEASGSWGDFAPLDDLFVYSGSGVMPGRTWVIAPDVTTLEQRWQRLQTESDPAKKETLFHPHLRNKMLGDKHVGKPLKQGLSGHEFRSLPVSLDQNGLIKPVRYGFRSFDRQWIVPDARLINQSNPTLWESHSDRQVYLTALHRYPPRNGPAMTFTGLLPDLDHYKGSFGGRAFPLWSDRQASASNIKPALLAILTNEYNYTVSPEDFLAYLAAVASHPAYTARFQADLIQPGLRIPITAKAELFAEAANIGREIIWLQTFGERFIDAAAGRPAGAPRMPTGYGPSIPKEGAIPSDSEHMPDAISYDAPHQRIYIGDGYVENVPARVWHYEVSGKQVLTQWFSYRGHNRERPVIGERRPPSPLEKIQPDHWLSEYTTELLTLLHVLGRLVILEEQQADLLQRICEGQLLTEATLRAAGTFAAQGGGRSSGIDDRQGDMFSSD